MRALQLTNARKPFFESQLAGLAASGVECDVCAPRTGEVAERGPADYLRYYPSVLRESVRGYDVVHANYGLTGPFALAQPTRPTVLTLWGSDVMGDSALVARLSHLAERRADAVVAPSETIAEAADAECDVVPFGVDTDLFRPLDRAEAREAVGWPADRDVILFPYDPSRPEKNFPLAERVAERAGAEVRTVSGVDYEAMPRYVNAADALLVTSTREGGPMTVKEAAACNVPVVSTDVGFAAEVLDGVANSHVRDDEDGLVAAVESVLAGDRRSDGRETVPVLSVEEMGRELRAVYERVAD